MKRLVFLCAIGGIALGGCDNDLGDYSTNGCPPLIKYSASDQREAAAEIRKHPNGQLAKMVRDYGKMRKACRV